MEFNGAIHMFVLDRILWIDRMEHFHLVADMIMIIKVQLPFGNISIALSVDGPNREQLTP
jgi:hypothetical protein